MRFTYNKKEYYINNSMELIDIASTKKIDEIGKNDPQIINITMDNYTSFLSKIDIEEKTKTDKKYYCFLLKNTLYIGIKEFNGPIILKIIYNIENNEIINLFRDFLTNSKDSNEGKVIIGNICNNYNFLIPLSFLRFMIVYADIVSKKIKPYHEFSIVAKSGKVRKIVAPEEHIKNALKNINIILQSIYDKKNIDFQVAYKKGKSIKDNAMIHKDNQYIYNIDLKDFYPSCKEELVKKYIGFFFNQCPNRFIIEKKFLDMILYNGALFIGSPISGCLANTIINKPVLYMRNICNKNNVKFSVYADDMSFSSDRYLSKKFVIGIFNSAFAKYSLDSFFTIKDEKCFGASKNRRKATGVTINGNNKLTVNRRYYRMLRVKLDKLSKGDLSINTNKLRGQLAFATMLDDSGKIYNYLMKFKSTVDKFSLCTDKKLDELKLRM